MDKKLISQLEKLFTKFEEYLQKGKKIDIRDLYQIGTFPEFNKVFNIAKNIIKKELSTFKKPIEPIVENKIILNSVKGMIGFYLFFIKIAEAEKVFFKDNNSLIFLSCIMGTVGYKIVDMHVDKEADMSNYLSFASLLIKKHQISLLTVFGETQLNNSIINNYDTLLQKVVTLETESLHKAKPYYNKTITSCGEKSLHLFCPIALLLLSARKNEQEVLLYENVFLNMASILQIIDDIGDLEEDINRGHYSWITNFVKYPYKITEINENVINDIYMEVHKLLEQTHLIINQINNNPFKILISIIEIKFWTLFIKLKEQSYV